MVAASLLAFAEAAARVARAPATRKAAIEVTEAAAQRIRDLLDRRHKASVALSDADSTWHA
jgi:hypothetical protein